MAASLVARTYHTVGPPAAATPRVGAHDRGGSTR
jgi:hypothetical protein